MATDEDRLADLEAIHKAVLTYGQVEFEALARRVIHHLQRMPASGIFGDDFRYRSIWDEWCHEVQEGPHELLEHAWDDAILPIINATLESIPAHVETLLVISATGRAPRGRGASVQEGHLQDALRRELEQMAINRDIEHLRA